MKNERETGKSERGEGDEKGPLLLSDVIDVPAIQSMDGWKTLEALRKIRPDVRVILASGYDEASVMSGDHPEWPQAFLAKPYSLEDLRETIGRTIEPQMDTDGHR